MHRGAVMSRGDRPAPIQRPNGAVFHKGKLLERPIAITPAQPAASHETEVA
jgi:hypothetical protein